MEQILDAISEQSGIKIAYSTEELATNKSVSVDIKTSDIKEALSAVLGDGYTFKQIDNYIAIAKKQKMKYNPLSSARLMIDLGQSKVRYWKIQNLLTRWLV